MVRRIKTPPNVVLMFALILLSIRIAFVINAIATIIATSSFAIDIANAFVVDVGIAWRLVGLQVWISVRR